MQTIISIKPLLAVLAGLTCVFLVMFSRRKPNLREFWSLVCAVVMFSIVASMIPAIWAGNRIEYTLFQILPGVNSW